MDKKITLSRPTFTKQDMLAVTNVLKSGMLVQGIKVKEFETSISNFMGVKYASLVSNGTVSMLLALKILGIKKGDEVIVPAFSYVASANVIELMGAKPVFVDIDSNTFNIDENKIEAKITNKTKAIIVVHEFGLACNIEKIKKICLKHKIKLIEDAACALGATQNNKHVGTFGDFGSFSFHPRKAITSGEGGLLTTNNIAFANKIEIFRNHGLNNKSNDLDFIEAGFNFRLTDFQAALLSSQLKRFSAILKKREKLASIYFNEIKNKNIQLPYIPKDRNHTFQTFHVILNNKIDRGLVIQKLKKDNIYCNLGAQCIPMQSYYKKTYKLNSKKDFHNSFIAFTQGLAIPLHENLTENDIKFVTKKINSL